MVYIRANRVDSDSGIVQAGQISHPYAGSITQNHKWHSDFVYRPRNVRPTLYERVLAALTGIEVKRIKNGRYNEEEARRIADANEWMKKQPFVHMYRPDITEEELYAICKILKYKMGLQFVIYDYIKSNESDSSVNYKCLRSHYRFLKE